ncbi:MAG: antitoxin [Hydrocarboniphaga sp.]|uniref:antitoxin n=1 Tax=Hydrocarboniphaga sp. TaxID=2033016 RepID=UPI00262A40F0|nr:type II toxin-antitoxin system VapB family antitoxin [Hydrocarboniphaga sp.]MDB5970215.1 antitoxin [Hydrocarboniphaga sp.]
MATARVFQSGNSQAVRLPKQFRLDASEVEIFRRGDEIVLKEKAKGMATAFHLLAGMPDDFFADGRKDVPPQKRKGL